jgi:hypothetical protein
VPGQHAAGAQPATELADDGDPVTIVANEGDEAVALGARQRLSDVVQEGTEAQCRATVHFIRQRIGEQRRQLLRARAAKALQVSLDLERAFEHGDRVAVHVEVVVGPLLDPP